MNNKDKRFFNIAKEVSKLSDFHGAHIGAVVVEGKHIISSDFNSFKTRPLQFQYNIYRNFKDYPNSQATQHAEIGALSRLIGKDINWSNVSIYTYRELKDGTIACSRPCPACMALINKLGIKTIYYTDECGNFVKEKIL